LSFDDLFPPRAVGDLVKSDRRPFPASDILCALAFEAAVVHCAASTMARGDVLPRGDRDRLTLAVSRVQSAITESGYGR